MALPRALRVLLVLALVPALAGCNFADWYKQRGTVYVELAPQAAGAISDFRVLKVAVYGVSLKKLGGVEPYEFAFTEAPLIVDLVQTSKAGQTIPLVENKTNLRAFESVTIRVDVAEAIDASGKSLPGCHPGQPVESRPCVSTPVNGAYRVERSFSPPRGGSATFYVPLGVQFTASANEYFIQLDPNAVRIETDE
jgi:hypothetical protein